MWCWWWWCERGGGDGFYNRNRQMQGCEYDGLVTLGEDVNARARGSERSGAWEWLLE